MNTSTPVPSEGHPPHADSTLATPDSAQVDASRAVPKTPADSVVPGGPIRDGSKDDEDEGYEPL